MVRIVINSCFGGFGLSDEGIKRYAELKGLKLYPEVGKYDSTTYWTVPINKRSKLLKHYWKNQNDPDLCNSLTKKEQNKLNKELDKSIIYNRYIPRDDPILVQVVEELKEKANGDCAKLKVVEIPDGVDWEIDEYDGNESIEQVHQSWS
jgi:hypothetical protein